MADGNLTLKLDAYTSAKIEARAKAVGIAPEVLAAQVITEALAAPDGLFADHASNYDLQEEGRPWSEVRPELVARMERKLAERS